MLPKERPVASAVPATFVSGTVIPDLDEDEDATELCERPVPSMVPETLGAGTGTVIPDDDEDEEATELLPDEHSVVPPIPVLPEEDEDVSSAERNEKEEEKKNVSEQQETK